MTYSSRREFLRHFGGGLGSLAFLALSDAERRRDQGTVHGPHHAPKARRVVQFFMSGAASQCDLFDYKPLLIQRDGQPFDPGEKVELFQSSPGNVMKSPFGWRRNAATGKHISALLPHIGSVADRICFLHGMTSKSNVHGPATLLSATGFVQPGFPSAGAWVSYGLGSANENLPAFVVLPDSRGYPPCGPTNWTAGFLPAGHQGTMIRPDRRNPIADLWPPKDIGIDAAADRDGLAVLRSLNEMHRDQRPGDDRLDARIASYELAARLQLSAPELLTLQGEPESVRTLYGLDRDVTREFGRNCLLARRMLERGVRFVQIWSGADNGFPRRNWDSHEDLARDHGVLGTSIDQPIAALILDLERRGMLDDTLVVWTTEFGRMPCSQGAKGRDHNPFGYTSFVAGGGIKPGISYGETDEWSYKAVAGQTTIYDLHATLLHLLGLNHERLTVRNNGIDRRLTDVHGRVLHEILA